MRYTKIDFNVVDTEEKLYQFLEKEMVQKYVSKNYTVGSIDGFLDWYDYDDAEELVELENLENIKDPAYKKFIKEQFLWVLEKLKETNKNFDYKILS